jgi:hypothetical protein
LIDQALAARNALTEHVPMRRIGFLELAADGSRRQPLTFDQLSQLSPQRRFGFNRPIPRIEDNSSPRL